MEIAFIEVNLGLASPFLHLTSDILYILVSRLIPKGLGPKIEESLGFFN